MAQLGALRYSHADRRPGLLIIAGLAVFVAAVYLLVVLGGGQLIGQTDSPNLAFSVLATAIVALGFESVQKWLESVARDLFPQSATSPYDVLSRFSSTVVGEYDSGELPNRMTKVLTEGTGAQWAQTWLVTSSGLVLAATWPPDASADKTPPSVESGSLAATQAGCRTLPVRHAGQLLAVLRLQERRDVALTAVEERLFTGLAAQAGLVLRAVALRVELSQRLAELSARATELRLSRQRLVDAQDEERRRLERDIHDGAQQHLVALAVNLRLAQTLLDRAPERAAQVLERQGVAARDAIDTLTNLARGIYPDLLSEHGLVPALQAMASISPLPVQILADHAPRASTEIEAAVYFCCLEALQNVSKHSHASRAVVRIGCGPAAELAVTISDDGHGFDPAVAAAGAGLTNMRDRIDDAGGTLTVQTAPGRGTRIEILVPVSTRAIRIR